MEIIEQLKENLGKAGTTLACGLIVVVLLSIALLWLTRKK